MPGASDRHFVRKSEMDKAGERFQESSVSQDACGEADNCEYAAASSSCLSFFTKTNGKSTKDHYSDETKEGEISKRREAEDEEAELFDKRFDVSALGKQLNAKGSTRDGPGGDVCHVVRSEKEAAKNEKEEEEKKQLIDKCLSLRRELRERNKKLAELKSLSDRLRGVAVEDEKEDKKEPSSQGLNTNDVFYYAPELCAYFDDLIEQGYDHDPSYNDPCHGMLAPVRAFESKEDEYLARELDASYKKSAFKRQFETYKAFLKKNAARQAAEEAAKENKKKTEEGEEEEGEENLATQ